LALRLHVELILEINKTVIVASSWSSIFTLPKLKKIAYLYQILIIFSLVRSRTFEGFGHLCGIRDARNSYNFDEEIFWK
jgi:hypothetical protein